MKIPFSLQSFLIGYLVVICTAQLTSALALSYQNTIQSLQNLDTPFSERFTYKLGGASYYGWIWPFSQFILRHTEENAQILIPPMSDTYKMEGNPDYFRWFMYPRKLVHLQEGMIPSNTEYILLTFGECSNNDCSWPPFDIPKEEIDSIIYINRLTQEETTVIAQKYTYQPTVQQWGIIRLKK